MKKLLFYLLLLTVLSFRCLANDINNIIKIDLISKQATKTYYTIFSTSTMTFIFYDEMY